MLKIAHIREEETTEEKPETEAQLIARLKSPEFIDFTIRQVIREHNAKIAKQSQR